MRPRIAAVAVVLAAGVLPAGCSLGGGDDPRPRTPVSISTDGQVATVRAQERDIYRTVRLEGTVEAYDAVPVTAAETGRFIPVAAATKARTVTKGKRIGTIACPAPPPAAPPAGTGTEAGGTTPAPTQTTTGKPGEAGKPGGQGGMLAPTPAPSTTPPCRVAVRAGTAGRMPALKERDVSTGETIASVQPGGLRVRLPVPDPAMLYAFKNPPESGKAEIVGGPSGFRVAFERRAYDKGSGATTVFVRMSADVDAFAGLKAIVVFVTDVKDGLLTLPLSAVRGRSGEGQVVTVDAQGGRVVTDVELGASDDGYVAVTGIDEETDVLLYPLESDFGG